MAFNAIDPTTPAGTTKIKFGDDHIREFKAQTIDNFKEVSNYPATTKPALRTAVWSTAQRPAGTELVDRVTGYNTDLGCEEYYDLASVSWKQKHKISDWTVATRPTTPYTGQYGYNTNLAVIESWDGAAWKRVSGGRRGDIKMWSGAVTDIEGGWVLSDGVERDHPEGGKVTPPNLRDRFIVGAGTSYAVGAIGGETHHTLTADEVPSNAWATVLVGTGGNAINSAGNHVSVAGLAHENRPPYYALCYLYKL